MIDSSDINILEEIISSDGDCLKADRCAHCPFRSKCLPKFLKAKHQRPSKVDRVNIALDTLAKHTLLNDEQEFIIEE